MQQRRSIKYENLATVVHVPLTMQDLVIQLCCFVEEGKDINVQRFIILLHSYLFFSLNLLLVAVSLPLSSWFPQAL